MKSSSILIEVRSVLTKEKSAEETQQRYEQIWSDHMPESGVPGDPDVKAVWAISRLSYDYDNNGGGNVINDHKLHTFYDEELMEYNNLSLADIEDSIMSGGVYSEAFDTLYGYPAVADVDVDLLMTGFAYEWSQEVDTDIEPQSYLLDLGDQIKKIFNKVINTAHDNLY